MEKNEIVLFESKDGAVSLPVSVEADTVWLSLLQMAKLFGKDKTVIFRHVKNAIADGEIDPKVTSAKFAMVTQHGAIPGKTRVQEVDCYNLDVTISIGYRVKSQRGVEFRRWATSVLKEYLVRGYAVNRERIRQLGQTVEVMKLVANSLDTEQVLDVVQTYSAALDLLDGYDHQTIEKPKTRGRSVALTYEECRRFIDGMKFAADSPLFGNEKDGSFKSALGAVYQSFGGKDLYPSSQEKAANLLYLVTKNHGFSDGNKRIAAGLFLYFLKRNRLLLRKDGSKRIADTLRLHSDLGGSGLLNIKYGGENNTKAEYLYGILELSGDNRNFAGKFYLSMEGHARWPIVVPSATVNVTAKVFDGFGFGGELAAFTYDALTVTNFCRVTVMDDADFTPVTRGWYLTDEKAFVKVEDGKTAKLRSVLTLNDNTTMVKEGAGAFWLYQTPSVRGTGAATVNVSAGVLGAGSANAFDGLSLTFADGALAVPALGGEGIDLTNVASIGGTGLKVKIDMTGIAEKSGDYAVPVLKFPKDTAYATRFAEGSGNLSVTLMNKTKGYCVKGLRYVDDGENITVTAGLTVGGFLLFVK